MRRRCAVAVALTALLSGVGGPAPAQTSADAWSALRDGSIVLFRHADAPGIGDPPGMKLDDCSTQRNLGDAGRAQARRIGEQFRTRGVKPAAVLTSQWCRTRETAELAFPGAVRDDARFNSFFGEPAREPAHTAAARAFLGAWRGPGVLVVVTHQINISALTGVGPASGEGVVVRPQGGAIEVLGRLRP